MIYTVTLNPTIDRTLKLDSILSVGNMNRGELKNGYRADIIVLDKCFF